MTFYSNTPRDEPSFKEPKESKGSIITDRLTDVVAGIAFAALMTAFGAYLVGHYLGNLRRPYEPPRPYMGELSQSTALKEGNLEEVIKGK